jgi:hypothetical protein
MATGGDDDPASRFVRTAVEASADGACLAARVLVGQVGALAGALLAAGLSVSAITLPLAERAPAAGGRMPHLGATDAAERTAALELAARALAAGASVGASRAVLDFGPLALPVARAELNRAFARRESGEGDPGEALLADAVSARKALAPRLADACRWSLERLARDAERRGATLLLPAGASPWEVPTPREALALLEAFRGAPVALAYDPGRLAALRALGLPLSAATAAALAAAAGAVVENDAVGIQPGYLAGLGERDDTLPLANKLPARAPVIVTSAIEVTAGEVAAAVAQARARYGYG